MDLIGPVLIAVIVVVIGPSALFFGGAVWSAVVGHTATDDAERRNEDSDWVKHRAW